MHRLLKRQIKKKFGKNFNVNQFDRKTLELFEEITETYSNFDDEKKFLNYTIIKNKREIKNSDASILAEH